MQLLHLALARQVQALQVVVAVFLLCPRDIDLAHVGADHDVPELVAHGLEAGRERGRRQLPGPGLVLGELDAVARDQAVQLVDLDLRLGEPSIGGHIEHAFERDELVGKPARARGLVRDLATCSRTAEALLLCRERREQLATNLARLGELWVADEREVAPELDFALHVPELRGDGGRFTGRGREQVVHGRRLLGAERRRCRLAGRLRVRPDRGRHRLGRIEPAPHFTDAGVELVVLIVHGALERRERPLDAAGRRVLLLECAPGCREGAERARTAECRDLFIRELATDHVQIVEDLTDPRPPRLELRVHSRAITRRDERLEPDERLLRLVERGAHLVEIGLDANRALHVGLLDEILRSGLGHRRRDREQLRRLAGELREVLRDILVAVDDLAEPQECGVVRGVGVDEDIARLEVLGLRCGRRVLVDAHGAVDDRLTQHLRLADAQVAFEDPHGGHGRRGGAREREQLERAERLVVLLGLHVDPRDFVERVREQIALAIDEQVRVE